MALTKLERWRAERFHATEKSPSSSNGKSGDYRSPFQKDRDRILYSASFRRLAEITQVASPQRGYDIHNRLTHVLKVAQVARRLAEALIEKTPGKDIKAGHGLNPDVVETAALAHDLGHPPFGHLAEEEIHEALTERGLTDGFEGNAQTFRIVTKLESRGFIRKQKHGLALPTNGQNQESADQAKTSSGSPLPTDLQQPFPGGLNLTRASLNAIMKYPWARKRSGKPSRKWSAYDTEADVYAFARDGLEGNSEEPTLEAQVMDWADDLAYGVHDFEDFYRAGLIPVAELVRRPELRKAFSDACLIRCNIDDEDKGKKFAAVAEQLICEFPFSKPYEGSPTERVALKSFSNSFIQRFMRGTKVKNGRLLRPPDLEEQVTVLKQFTWHYVIEGPGLALEQIGQREIIRNVLKTFIDHAHKNDLSVFGPRYKLSLQLLHDQRRRLDTIKQAHQISRVNDEILRISSDIIAHLSEREVLDIHGKIRG